MLFVHSVKWGSNVNISVKEKVGLSGGGGGGVSGVTDNCYQCLRCFQVSFTL